jgi:hypothetical protein
MSPFPTGVPVSKAAGEIYGKLNTGSLVYKAERMCVETEIVRGTGARWRLDDPHDISTLGAESHQFAVVLEASDAPLDAAGYLQAYSTTKWVTATLGSVWRDFKKLLKSYFQRGLPVEAYAEWKNILDANL